MSEGWRVWRHKKRGTVYREILHAEVQAAEPIPEGAKVVVYQGQDGRYWAREYHEFNDGR